jgi:hypothetical protein
MNNYPPGVSGTEIEITGADEYTAERTVICWEEACRSFEKEKTLSLELSANRTQEWADWDCPDCNTTQYYEGSL